MSDAAKYPPRARLEALERRHTGPPPREDWLEARLGGAAALADLRAVARRADASRTAALYRLAIARLRSRLGGACHRDAPQSARLAGLSAALHAARTQAVAGPCAGSCARPCNCRGIG